MNEKQAQLSLKDHAILHVLVVGFHHKRGYQIEYCYPAIAGQSKSPDLEKAFPSQWCDLALLAIPDGAHNVESDIIFFVLPSPVERNRAVYGISCYRQISADVLHEKDDDITRSSVQKSVCVLSKVPLYGILKSKLELITQTYFNEKDFSKVEVLVQMYNNLCDLFDSNYLDTDTIHSGISITPLLKTFKHRTLALFKLLLLEKRVIFNIFPANTLGNIMIGLISLFPGLLENGLSESASYSVLKICKPSKSYDEADEAIDVNNIELEETSKVSVVSETNSLQNKSVNYNYDSTNKLNNSLVLESTLPALPPDKLNKASTEKQSINPSSFDTDGYGFPLSIFTKGFIFHPYMGISSLDMLRSDNVRAFCVGVTNSIFTERHEFLDAIVSIDDKNDGVVEILSPKLRRQLTLTKQDLRFVDFLLKMMEMNNDTASWEGSDDWLRLQFNNYLLAMLATANSMPAASDEHADEFNAEYIKAWRTKHNFIVWSCGTHLNFVDISPKHPFAGQSSVNDVILRMNHAISGSGQGRKVISTFANTSKLMAETGNKFKSSLTSWVRGVTLSPSSHASMSSLNLEKKCDVTVATGEH